MREIRERRRARLADTEGLIDPTKVRMSDNLLLSDMIGCHSAYVKGLKNVFLDPLGVKLREGMHLCSTILEPIMVRFGPISIAYGYISDELSKKIVTYQDPSKPSYHRWDKGAAVDICIHVPVEKRAPVLVAHEIDLLLPYSRMITYSESPFICIASQVEEGSNQRSAFYENRYTGVPKEKPAFISKSKNARTRARQGVDASDDLQDHDWRGAGYPTYHGGGRRQLQHIRTSRYTIASDFLFSRHALSVGVPNVPTFPKFDKPFANAGDVYDFLLEALNIPKISIVRGFESFRFNDYPLFSWLEHFTLEVVPPSYVSPNELAEAARAHPKVAAVGVNREEGTVRIMGTPNE